MIQTHKTFCRHCMSLCGLEVGVENNRVVSVKGDRTHPDSAGYSCLMGQHNLFVHDDSLRLTAAQRRQPDGGFEAVDMGEALDTIGKQLSTLHERYGPRSIALYYGTGTAYSGLAYSMARSWLRAIGSPERYTSMTVDHSSAWVCAGRMGAFASGRPFYLDLDVMLLVGINPVISHTGWPVSPIHSTNTPKALDEARKRGIKTIVIDPRRTETAARADLFLQIKPGEDCTLLAAMIRVILENGWQNKTFCDRFVTSVDELRQAVEPFTLEHASQRTGVPAEQIFEAAQLFGKARRASAGVGTGASFAANSNLAEHLFQSLNALCGGYRRAGDRMRTTGFFNLIPRVEMVVPPSRPWLNEPKLRSADIGLLAEEFPSARLPDEILHPGEDRIRALIVCGGNPATAISGTRKTVKALKSLELLVTIDPRWSQTGRLSHYVIPTKLPFEREDINIGLEPVTPINWVNYSQPIVQAPPGVLEDWEVFWELGRRMGVPINFRTGPFGMQLPPGIDLDMVNRPTTSALLRAACEIAGVSYDELSRHSGGMALPHGEVTIRAAEADNGARLDVCPPDVAAEIAAVRAEPRTVDPRFRYRLISRRLPGVMNSAHTQIESVRKRHEVAPLFMHSADIEADGLVSGTMVSIASEEAQIVGRLTTDDTLRRGVVAMPMGWGSADPDDPHSTLSSQLISIDRDVEAINYMPRQTAIPVEIRAQETPVQGCKLTA